MTSTADPSLVELDSPGEVLRFARDRRAAADRAEADVLLAAVAWAEQHPPESIEEAATWFAPGVGDTGLTLAGEGAPLVAEFCIAELSLALGVSTDAGRSLVADGVELKYRLTRTWTRTTKTGNLPVRRARRIAQATNGLNFEAAAFVDAQVAPFAHKIGFAALERLVAEAIARFMPDRAAEDAQRSADGRCFHVHHDQVSFNGTSRIEGELDLADALDLDAAITREAEALKALGSTESLDVRRSLAAGQIARHQLALDLNTPAVGTADTTGTDTAAGRRRVKPRQVVLYVHLSQDAVTDTRGGCLDLARVENKRQVVTADQVRGWCANPDTEVVLTPVVDLNDHIAVEGYEVPDRLREQTTLRDRACVFPWCTRPARRADADHVIPHDRGGATASDNIAPLCRRHHRLKTHTSWTYTMLEPGSYLWSSPHGYQFLRDTEGTLDVSHDRRLAPSPGSRTDHRSHPPDQ
jgi:5-methylcytosine-specific restriction endonuclease McrA